MCRISAQEGMEHMSEVSDALQMIEVSGKGIKFAGKLTMKAFMQLLKLLNTLYLAKWKGKTNFTRLRNVKGEDLSFFQVGTEDRKSRKRIEKQLKKHGIMFARLPDLCKGDGKIQYAFSPSDAQKMQLFMQNYMQEYTQSNGKRNNVKVEMISGSDYEKTGYVNGEKTEEYQDLEQSAKKEIEKVKKTNRKKRRPRENKSEFSGEAAKKRFLIESRKKNNKIVSFEFAKTADITADSSRGKGCSMIEFPRGRYVAAISDQEIGAANSDGMQSAAIQKDKEYIVIDKKTLKQTKMKGSDLANHFRKPELRKELARKKNLKRNAANSKIRVPLKKAESR